MSTSARPLAGKRVLVTRAVEQSSAMLEYLADRGAEAVIAPVIEIRALADERALEVAIDALATYDWVAFTSANGVEHFVDALKRRGKAARPFGSARVAAVGPGTEAALARAGVHTDCVAPEHKGEGLAAAILEIGHAGERVLLPRALVARDVVPVALRDAGLHVDVVPVYETVAPSAETFRPVLLALSSGRIDAVTLTSASTAKNLVTLLGPDAIRLLSAVVVASIGPITTAAAAELGVRVDVSALPHTVPDLVLALEHHFEKLRPAPT